MASERDEEEEQVSGKWRSLCARPVSLCMAAAADVLVISLCVRSMCVCVCVRLLEASSAAISKEQGPNKLALPPTPGPINSLSPPTHFTVGTDIKCSESRTHARARALSLPLPLSLSLSASLPAPPSPTLSLVESVGVRKGTDRTWKGKKKRNHRWWSTQKSLQKLCNLMLSARRVAATAVLLAHVAEAGSVLHGWMLKIGGGRGNSSGESENTEEREGERAARAEARETP